MSAVFTFPKRHWRKFAVLTPVVAVAAYFGYSRKLESDAIGEACRWARQFGQQTIKALDNPNKCVVFVNPWANNQKAVGQVERALLPILHIAGVDARVIKTQSEGDAMELVSVADDANFVVVAGGDGTISEVITGMLGTESMERIPLLIVPVGYRNNSTARRIYKSFRRGHAIENIIGAAKSVLNEPKLTCLNLMELRPSGASKSYYSAASLHLGFFRDVQDEALHEKFWYFGPLKKYFAAFLRVVNYDSSSSLKFKLSWTVPCSGCKLCKASQISDAAKNGKSSNFWWQRFFGSRPKTDEKILKWSSRANPSCGVVRSEDVSVDQFIAGPTLDCLELSLVAVGDRYSLMKESMRRLFYPDLRNLPTTSCGSLRRINCRQFWLEPLQDTPDLPMGWFSIDNENMEAVPLQARFCADQLKIFKESV